MRVQLKKKKKTGLTKLYSMDEVELRTGAFYSCFTLYFYQFAQTRQ